MHLARVPAAQVTLPISILVYTLAFPQWLLPRVALQGHRLAHVAAHTGCTVAAVAQSLVGHHRLSYELVEWVATLIYLGILAADADAWLEVGRDEVGVLDLEIILE